MEICQKCGGTKYTDALKKYNAGKPAWCIPRKGTAEYKNVLDLIEKPKTRKLRKAPVQASVQVSKKRITKIDPDLKALMKKPKGPLKPSNETITDLESVFNGSSLTFNLDKSGAYFLTIKDGNRRVIVRNIEPGTIIDKYLMYEIAGYLGKYIIKVTANIDDPSTAKVEVFINMKGGITLSDFNVDVM